MPSTIETYLGDGSTTIYTFSFDYILKEFVQVLVEGVAAGFTLTAAHQITLDAAPAVGETIVIRRSTDAERLVEFIDGSVLVASDMNLSALQAIHVAEESRDYAAGSLLIGEDGQYYAGGRKITGLSTPTDDNDAATKGWVENDNASSVAQARAARDTAVAAQTVADASKDAAVAAAATATSAETTATAAASTASTAASNADTDAGTASAAAIDALAAATRAEDAATIVGDNGVIAPGAYASRASLVAATVPAPVKTVSLRVAGNTKRKPVTLLFTPAEAGETNPAITTDGGTRAWVPDGDVTPLHFGAVGDGVTDDAAAIQAAIDYTTLAKAPLVIPEGVFLVNTGLTVDTDNHIIIGKGCGGFSSEVTKEAASVIKAGAVMDAIITYLTPTLTGSNAGNRIEGVKLLGEAKATRGLWFQEANWQPVMVDLKIISCDTCIQLDTSCWGPRFDRVMVDFRDIGFDLRENNHNAVFNSCVTRASTSGTVGVRIGFTGSSSNINFYGCDFEADHASTAQVQALQGRAIGFFGCYMEGRDGTSGAAGIALGRSDGSEFVEGVAIHGCYFQGLDTGSRAILLNAARGVHIASSHFRSWVVRAFTTTNEANVRGLYIDPSVSMGGTISESDSNTRRATAGLNYLSQSLAITADLADGQNLYLETPAAYGNPMVVSAEYSPRINGEVTFNCLNTSAGSNDVQFDGSNFISAGTLTLTSGKRGVVRFVQDGGTGKLVEHSRSIY